MIRYKIRELVEDKRFKEGRRIKLEEVAQDSGVHKTTLSKILNIPNYHCSLEVIDKFCQYFGIQVGDVIEYVPDPHRRKSAKKK